MSTIMEILDAAERRGPDEFVKLRRELDKVEKRVWARKHRKANLTDARIDALVLKRRRAGRRT